MERDLIHATLRLGDGDAPLEGHLELPGGERLAFAGWLGLMSAVEEARERLGVTAGPAA